MEGMQPGQFLIFTSLVAAPMRQLDQVTPRADEAKW